MTLYAVVKQSDCSGCGIERIFTDRVKAINIMQALARKYYEEKLDFWQKFLKKKKIREPLYRNGYSFCTITFYDNSAPRKFV